MKKTKYNKICIVFENCEYCYIDAKLVEYIFIDSITESIDSRNYRSVKECFFHNYKTCNEFSIMLTPSCKDIKPQFTKNYFSKEGLFDRITHYPDIVSIEFLKNNKLLERIYVPFDGNENNQNQETHFDSNGALIVEIKEKIDD